MLRIDPAAPPLWRSVDSLQFGVDPVLARLDGVPPGADRVLAALLDGTDRRTLRALAKEDGLGRAGMDALLDAVTPALAGTATTVPAVRAAVEGDVELAPPLAAALGVDAEPGEPDLVVLVARHLVRPADTVRLLIADVPHLAVVFGDQAAVVGPFVLPGTTSCLRCADEHRLDDPAWRAIAAQLLHRRSVRTGGVVRVTLLAALAVADAIEALRDGRPTGLEGAALRIALDGRVSRVPRPPHARCSCRAPAGPAPAGTGTASASPVAARPSAPTTGAAGPAPA